jgi:hypothetical protein
MEWDGKHLLIHRDKGIQVIDIDYTARSSSNEAETALINEMSGNSKFYALFAVRPSGFDSFNGVKYDFTSAGIDVGFEPIEQSRPLNNLRLSSVP